MPPVQHQSSRARFRDRAPDRQNQRKDEAPRKATVLLQVSRAEDAGDHRNLAGVPDCVLDDAVEHGFVWVAAAGNLFAQMFDGKIAKMLFEKVAAVIPARD